MAEPLSNLTLAQMYGGMTPGGVRVGVVTPPSWRGLGLPFQPVYTANQPSATPMANVDGSTPDYNVFETGERTPRYTDSRSLSPGVVPSDLASVLQLLMTQRR